MKIKNFAIFFIITLCVFRLCNSMKFIEKITLINNYYPTNILSDDDNGTELYLLKKNRDSVSIGKVNVKAEDDKGEIIYKKKLDKNAPRNGTYQLYPTIDKDTLMLCYDSLLYIEFSLLFLRGQNNGNFTYDVPRDTHNHQILLSPNNEHFVIAYDKDDQYGTIVLFDTMHGSYINNFKYDKFDGNLPVIAFNSDNSYIAAGMIDGTISLNKIVPRDYDPFHNFYYNCDNDRRPPNITESPFSYTRKLSKKISGITFVHDDLIAVASQNKVFLFTYWFDRQAIIETDLHSISSLHVSRNNNYLIALGTYKEDSEIIKGISTIDIDEKKQEKCFSFTKSQKEYIKISTNKKYITLYDTLTKVLEIFQLPEYTWANIVVIATEKEEEEDDVNGDCKINCVNSLLNSPSICN